MTANALHSRPSITPEPFVSPSTSHSPAPTQPGRIDLAADIYRCKQAYRNSLILLISLTSFTTLSIATAFSFTT